LFSYGKATDRLLIGYYQAIPSLDFIISGFIQTIESILFVIPKLPVLKILFFLFGYLLLLLAS